MFYGHITQIKKPLDGNNSSSKRTHQLITGFVSLDEHNKRQAAKGIEFRLVWFEPVKGKNLQYTLSDNTHTGWVYQECVICPVVMTLTARVTKIKAANGSMVNFRVCELDEDTQEYILQSLHDVRFS